MVRKKIITVSLGLVISFISLSVVQASEELLFEDIQLVSIGLGMEQKITDVPAAVSVITAKDINDLGASNLAENFRRVPGVDIALITLGRYAITTRRANERFPNKMMVMIDGRTLYTIGGISFAPWENYAFMLEEIEQIEVLRGPISVLYGANSFSGIINVKTKSPKDLKGTYIKTAYSDLEDLYGGIIHGGEINALSYKVSASWDRGENLENVWGGKERELNRVDVRGDYDLDFDKKIFVQSGQIDGQYQVRCLNGGSFKEIIPGERYYRIGYEQGELQLTAYRNRSRPHELSISGGSVKSVESDLYNLDLNHSFAWGENLSFVWGGNISKEKAVNPDIIYDKLTARLWSAYLQNQIRLTEKVIMSLGSRIDDDSVRGNNFTPRIGFVYEPIENHAYRISYSTAYRKPSFLELFRYLKNKSGTNLGNEDLDNEELKSIELGYYGIFSKNLKGSVALFFNEIEHLIEEYTVSSKVFNYRNIEQKVESLGGEIEANYAIQNGISCFANYAYEYLRYKDSGERIKSSPLNKINLGIITELTKEFSVNMFVSYVDSVEWAQSGVYTVDSKTPSYTLLNSRIAYKFTENGKATMEIFNILNDKHKEYPYGEEIGQRITVGVNYNF